MTGPDPVDVLVVDDDADARLLLRAILESVGIGVVEAADGAEALAIVRGGRELSLMLLDLHMPGLSGAEVLDRLRSEAATADLPVMIRSGSTESGEEAALRSAGADDVVSKADPPPQLLARVQALLRRIPPSSPV